MCAPVVRIRLREVSSPKALRVVRVYGRCRVTDKTPNGIEDIAVVEVQTESLLAYIIRVRSDLVDANRAVIVTQQSETRLVLFINVGVFALRIENELADPGVGSGRVSGNSRNECLDSV